MSVTATSLLNVARSQLGYREGRNNDNKFGQWYGLNHAPYCAIGLMWCAHQLGVPTFFGGRWAYCPTWVQMAKQLGLFHSWKTTPAPGDIVFFDWSGRHGLAQHVGLVESFSGSTVTTIEFNTTSGAGGNQSDGGGVWRRKRSTRFVVGYARPPYSAQTPPKKVVPAGTHKVSLPLVIDGVWGASTTKRLQLWLKVPTTGALDVVTKKALQSKLHLMADGAWGPVTRRALQRALGVTADGTWGPNTVKHLQAFLNKVV